MNARQKKNKKNKYIIIKLLNGPNYCYYNNAAIMYTRIFFIICS